MRGLDHVINCDVNKSLNPKQAYWILLPVSYLRRVCPVCLSGATPHGLKLCILSTDAWSKAGRVGKLKCSLGSQSFVSSVLFSVDFGISIINFLHRFVTKAAGFIQGLKFFILDIFVVPKKDELKSADGTW